MCIKSRMSFEEIDEILNDNPNIYDGDRLNHKYWKEVKREIGLL